MKLDFRIKECEFGRGLFATRYIAEGEIIEVSPLILIPINETFLIDSSVLGEYVFAYDCPNNKYKYGLALGFGSLFNHSEFNNNVKYEIDYENNVIIFRTNRRIVSGEQLFIDYEYTPPRFNK